MEQNKGEGRVRLFVGGLSAEVSSIDLKERFAPLGTVLSVTTPPAKHGCGPHRGFAYVDFLPTSEGSLRKLFSAYNGCKWRGGILRIEGAKEHYADKLQKEWAAEAEALAAEEVKRLRKKSDVPPKPAPNQAKSWPLLLLEQPEKPDKWKRKRDFEQGAESDGIKIFFPRLKKVKTVPSKGLGKHKRSFQRVESLQLQQLSTCDCEESLRTGSCDCSIAQPVSGDVHNHLVTSGEYDPISLEIAKERQRQLELLSRLFPSESPRSSKPAMELTTSSPRNGAEIKKGATMEELTADDSERGASVMETSSQHLENDDDSGELLVPLGKRDSWKDAAEVVEMEVHEPEILPPQTEEGSPEVQAEEPEMWVSFMDTTPLPVRTVDDVSEFDSDEVSETEEQIEVESPEIQADEPEMWVSFMDTMPLPVKTEENVSEFDSDEVSETEEEIEVESPEIQADEADEPEMWVNFMDTMPLPLKRKENVSELHLDEPSKGEEETEERSPEIQADEPEMRVSSEETEEESPEILADEPEMWVSSVGAMPLPVKAEENVSEIELGELSKTEEQVLKASQANEAPEPKRNELTRATWKSLVGETGRVVFSLQQVLGGNSTPVNQARPEPIALEDTHLDEKYAGSEAAKEKDVTSSSPSTSEPGEKKHGIMNTARSSLKPRKDFFEVDDTPPVPLFTDSNVCPFMKSPDAEKEWLATKLELRTDYRSKHKQAVKKSRKLRGR